jgi:hypothetical protein
MKEENADGNKKHLIQRIHSDALIHFISKFLKNSNQTIHRCLQIGLDDGVLASKIVDATKKLLIVVDPKQEYKNFAGIKHLKAQGNWEYIDFRDDYAYAVLPKLLEGNVLPDFIVLDGDLKFDYLLTDFFYCDLILKNKSYILIRNHELQSVKLVHQFIQTNRLEYEIINQEFEEFTLYQKINRDAREMTFLKKFD